MSFSGLRMLKSQIEPISKKFNIFEKYPLKTKLVFFLKHSILYKGILKETIRMPFRGLAMLKSTKLIIKGGLCYRFAMVKFCIKSNFSFVNQNI